MIWHESDCYKEIEPNGMFFKYKKTFFEYLDRMLDDSEFEAEMSVNAINRAKELSKNESKMLGELHKKLYIC
jgi:hypothetical protein